jgi:hypothetical protein
MFMTQFGSLDALGTFSVSAGHDRWNQRYSCIN